MVIKQALRDYLVELNLAKASWEHNAPFAEAAMAALESGKLTPEKFSELQYGKDSDVSKRITPSKVFGGDSIRVKKPSERYSNVKSVGKHAKTGLPVTDEHGKQVETVSELEKFQAGCWLKYTAAKSGLPVQMAEHEREAVEEIFAEQAFCGKIGGVYENDIPGSRVKALISDSTSGGVELNPTFFDSAVITFPLLHSEFLPRIDLRDMPRGAAVETASIGNPTVFWGGGLDGTSTSPFDTSSLVAEIAATVRPVTVAVEVGRDFLSDAAADVGRILVENIGQRMLAELDKVIIKGDGLTQPQGIFNASGLTDIGNPTGGNGAAPQVSDLERLLFGVPKQYRNASMRCAFFGNDVTYSRIRGIAVGASDARRVFGMDHGSYSVLEHPFLISNDLGNAYCGFGALAKYRLWRRMAQEVRWTTEGRELTLKNLALLTVRGRYAGKVVDGAAFAFTDNAQA
ncbi:MAG: phage major capsid protein [Planctomycetaceae bacterium]|nr:phage major capsid protein [Planctomycetaceae bacterium]